MQWKIIINRWSPGQKWWVRWMRCLNVGWVMGRWRSLLASLSHCKTVWKGLGVSKHQSIKYSKSSNLNWLIYHSMRWRRVWSQHPSQTTRVSPWNQYNGTQPQHLRRWQLKRGLGLQLQEGGRPVRSLSNHPLSQKNLSSQRSKEPIIRISSR